jgi:hypothetical protein
VIPPGPQVLQRAAVHCFPAKVSLCKEYSMRVTGLAEHVGRKETYSDPAFPMKWAPRAVLKQAIYRKLCAQSNSI